MVPHRARGARAALPGGAGRAARASRAAATVAAVGDAAAVPSEDGDTQRGADVPRGAAPACTGSARKIIFSNLFFFFFFFPQNKAPQCEVRRCCGHPGMTTRPARDRTALSLAPVFRSCWGSGSSARVPAASSHRLGCGASRRGRGPVPASALLGPARPSRTAALCGPDPAPHTRGDPRRPPRLPPPGNSAAGGARSDWPLLVTRSRLLGAARASIGWRRCQSERASPPAARAALSWGGRCCRASRRLVLVRLRAEQGCRLRGGGRHSGAERRANAAGKLRPRGGKADACLYARPFRLAPEGPTAA